MFCVTSSTGNNTNDFESDMNDNRLSHERRSENQNNVTSENEIQYGKSKTVNFHSSSVILTHRLEGWNIINSIKVTYRKSLFYIKNSILALEKEGEKMLNSVNLNETKKRKWVENSMKVFETSFDVAVDVQAESKVDLCNTIFCMMLQFTVDLRDYTSTLR